MSRQKLNHIKEVNGLINVFNNPFEMEGKWRKEYFKNEGPLVLEIGCGSGQYTLNLARKYPEQNFIGIDKKGDRIWRGAKEALGVEKELGGVNKWQPESLRNVGFVRCMAQKLDQCFGHQEVDEIWITFPDPFPKPSKENNRLFSPRFIQLYRKFLKPGGYVHLKTDSTPLFEYALEVAEKENLKREQVLRDIHGEARDSEIAAKDEHLSILTFYEEKFMAKGLPIFYARFRLV